MTNESQRILIKWADKDYWGNEPSIEVFIEKWINKAYQQGVLDSLGKLPKKKWEDEHDEWWMGYNQAIKESEASIKSLIE